VFVFELFQSFTAPVITIAAMRARLVPQALQGVYPNFYKHFGFELTAIWGIKLKLSRGNAVASMVNSARNLRRCL